MLEGNIGYIRLSMFSETTGNDFRAKKLQELKAQGMQALILDLRNNPGGPDWRKVSKWRTNLIPKGHKSWSVINKDGARENLHIGPWKKTLGPLVVLINGGSAKRLRNRGGAPCRIPAQEKLVGVQKRLAKVSVQRVVSV